MVKMRPPIRSRASTMQTRFPAADNSRAAARPATPAPMTMASKSIRTGSPHNPSHSRSARRRREFRGGEEVLPPRTEQRTRLHGKAPARRQRGVQRRSIVDDFRPGELANLQHFLVDLLLRSALAEDASKVIDLRRDQLVVLRQQAESSALQVAFGHGDGLGRFRGLFAHGNRNDDRCRSNPASAPTVFAPSRPCEPATPCGRPATPAPPPAAPSCSGRARSAPHRRAPHANDRKPRKAASPSPVPSQSPCRKIVAEAWRETTKLSNTWSASSGI